MNKLIAIISCAVIVLLLSGIGFSQNIPIVIPPQPPYIFTDDITLVSSGSQYVPSENYGFQITMYNNTPLTYSNSIEDGNTILSIPPIEIPPQPAYWDIIFEFNGTSYSFRSSEVLNDVDIYYYNVTDLPAGDYNYKWYLINNTDQLLSTDNIEYAINKSSDVTLNLVASSWSIKSNEQATVSCSATSNQVALMLYRNDVSVMNPDTVMLGAGEYDYICNSTESENYTAANTVTNKLIVTEPIAIISGGGGGGGIGITPTNVTPITPVITPTEEIPVIPEQNTVETSTATGPTGLFLGLTNNTVAGIVVIGIAGIGLVYYFRKKLFFKRKK